MLKGLFMQRDELFENAPVRKAVVSQIVPAILSQMIALIYNLADTYFVGLLNSPVHTAAVTVAYPPFLLLTAVSNLFGIGGASVLARCLGKKDEDGAKFAGQFAVWGGAFAAIVSIFIYFLLSKPILYLCGANADTFVQAKAYADYIILYGGFFAVVSPIMANLSRAQGNAHLAAFGVSLGGVLNIILDPLFILPRFLGMGAGGAGFATAVSNAASFVFFLAFFIFNRQKMLNVISVPKLKGRAHGIKDVLLTGLPSALQFVLTVVAVAAQARFISGYSTEAVAAWGITKKLDQLPLYFSIGVASGILPIIAYNHAAGNLERRKSIFRMGVIISVGFASICVVIYEIFAPFLIGLFISDAQTVSYGSAFLRIMVTAMPMMAFCYPMIIQFQGMGKVKESIICSFLRKGALDIPLLFALSGIFGLYGCVFVQPIVDTVSMIVSWLFYKRMD